MLIAIIVVLVLLAALGFLLRKFNLRGTFSKHFAIARAKSRDIAADSST
ncbi:hypothetical protein [Burkholderia anthina]